jgi:adenylate kinase family enzyme
MAAGGLVDVATTVAILKKAILEKLSSSKTPGILVDGFPRELEQAREFEAQFGRTCDVLLFLEASEDVVTQRLLARGETSGRSDDNLEAIKQRLQVRGGKWRGGYLRYCALIWRASK